MKKNKSSRSATLDASYDAHFQVAFLIATLAPNGSLKILSPRSEGVPANTPNIGIINYKMPVLMQQDDGGDFVYTPGLARMRLFWAWLSRASKGKENLWEKAKTLAFANPDRGPEARLMERMDDVESFWPGGAEFHALHPTKAGFGLRDDDVTPLKFSGAEIFKTGMGLEYREANSVGFMPELVEPDGGTVKSFYNMFYSPEDLQIPLDKIQERSEGLVLRYIQATTKPRPESEKEEPEWMTPATFFRAYDLDPVSFPMLGDMTRDDGRGRRFTYVGRGNNAHAKQKIETAYKRSLRKIQDHESFSSTSDFISEEELQAISEAANAAAETVDI